MRLALLLAVPLMGGLALLLVPGRARRPVHLLASALTLAAALAVAAGVVQAGVLAAADGILRADALSAWMVVLVAVVAGLAALEATRAAPPEAARWFLPLFHLFVFTMLGAVTTDDVGLMWVAIEGTTLASVFLVNAERSRESLEEANH